MSVAWAVAAGATVSTPFYECLVHMNAPEERSLILIIDDNIDSIRLLAGMLKGQARILFATSGEAGLQIARQRRPQLILLDVEMPGMDGYETCRRLKTDSETASCTVIFITAHANMESEVRGLEAGALDFIAKPLNPPVVAARVRTHLKLRHDAELLAQLAQHDGLTGLFNRRYFDDQVAKEFARHRRQQQAMALAFVDIDHFKRYNDLYGHQEGDICLQAVARAIDESTRRPGEIAARYGGEEFVVILPHTTPEEAQKYGEHLCERIIQLNLPHTDSSATDKVSISVGVASLVPGESDTPHKLIAQADQALYEAKTAGRNCARTAGAA